jgi:hypothetical protein
MSTCPCCGRQIEPNLVFVDLDVPAREIVDLDTGTKNSICRQSGFCARASRARPRDLLRRSPRPL